MPRNRLESLVEEELQAVVVGANGESVTPQVWVPMADNLNQAYELPLISSQFRMARGNVAAEEG